MFHYHYLTIINKAFFLILIILLVLPFCSSAHYVVGIVNDAKDGTIANDHEVVLWNPINGMQDNLTDIIGVNGNSNADNIYMFDCEQLLTPCEIDDELKIKVFDTGGGYLSKNISVIVTGAGFDLANNLTLNSPPIILSLNVDDDFAKQRNGSIWSEAYSSSVALLRICFNNPVAASSPTFSEYLLFSPKASHPRMQLSNSAHTTIAEPLLFEETYSVEIFIGQRKLFPRILLAESAWRSATLPFLRLSLAIEIPLMILNSPCSS